jgi:hypothetical protein
MCNPYKTRAPEKIRKKASKPADNSVDKHSKNSGNCVAVSGNSAEHVAKLAMVKEDVLFRKRFGC